MKWKWWFNKDICAIMFPDPCSVSAYSSNRVSTLLTMVCQLFFDTHKYSHKAIKQLSPTRLKFSQSQHHQSGDMCDSQQYHENTKSSRTKRCQRFFRSCSRGQMKKTIGVNTIWQLLHLRINVTYPVTIRCVELCSNVSVTQSCFSLACVAIRRDIKL